MKSRYTALREVRSKSESAIEKATSKNWLERSLACYEIYEKSGSIGWLTRAVSYAQEAKEHASLASDNGRTLRKVERKLGVAERRAARQLRKQKAKMKKGRR